MNEHKWSINVSPGSVLLEWNICMTLVSYHLFDPSSFYLPVFLFQCT